MKTILDKYRLPLFNAENENGAAPPPPADAEASAEAETNANADADSADGDAQRAEAEAAVAEQDAPEGMTAQEQEDWRDKEIRKKHAQIKQRDEKIKEQERMIADLRVLAERRANGEDAQDAAPQQQNQRVNLSDDAIKAAAQQLRDQERYAEQLNTTNSAGEKAYGQNWGRALDRLAQMGTIDPADMTAILNTDAPEKVLYELGSNPAEMQRIEALPPARRMTEYVKLSMKEAPKPKPSQAPAPVNGVKPRATPQTGVRDDMSDEAWYAERQKQKAERWKQRQALGR